MIRAVFVAIFAIASAIFIAPASPEPPKARGSFMPKPIQVPDQPAMTLEGVGVAVEQAGAWYAGIAEAERARVAEESSRQARDSRRPVTTRSTTSAPVIGSCADMKPAGFPDAIIQRESGGDPNARNPSGAYGCAQLMPGTGGSGSYAERWARTWAGGAGACNWQAPNYCG